MPRTRGAVGPAGGLAAALALAVVAPALAADTSLSPQEGYELVAAAGSGDSAARRAVERLAASGDRSLVAGLVDTLFFTPRAHRGPVLEALRALTGADPGAGYHDWVELVGAHPEWRPKPGYAQYKGLLLARIDPRFKEIFTPDVAAAVRLEEVVWGGVPVEGIPALESPPRIPAAEAGYLDDAEAVFGVALGGEAVAFPLRFLDWHEMLNDTVGGVPVTLGHCTLCGAGILYRRPVWRDATLDFGTSGLLHRSNKLMIDRATGSLWSHLAGVPVVGPLVGSGLELEILPMTRTTWGEWRRRHPATATLSLRELAPIGRAAGFRYQPGAADTARRGVSFPVWRRSAALAPDEEVFVVRLAGRARAWPFRGLPPVVNDAVGDVAVVLLAAGGEVRAWRRGERRFTSHDDEGLVDERGVRWTVADDELLSPTGERLARLPGHVALWHGWFGAFPDTELYAGE